jgi:mono/diheme cytochrome c family protein
VRRRRWNSPVAVGATALVALAGGVITLAGARADDTATSVAAPAGADLFRAKGCVGCHDGPDGAGSQISAGPDLRLLPLVAGRRVAGLDGRAYVRQSIQEPQAFVVPGYEPGDHALMPALPLSAIEIDALVHWLLPQPPRA